MSNFFRKALKPVLYIISFAVISLLLFYITLFSSLPPLEEIMDMKMQIPMRVYTQDKKLIAVYGVQKRSPISFDKIPDTLKNAFIAAEDERFYRHHGVDYIGLLRAFKNIILSRGEIKQGGSTITMQVARNFYLTSEKTISRKLREIMLAYKLERHLSKEKIFELYMNKIYLGNGAYGVVAAAQVYYGKNLSNLNLAQIAMIAGLPKAPSKYNPIINKEKALQRRNYVLKQMLENNYISRDVYDNAIIQPSTVGLNSGKVDFDAPYVGEMIRIWMEKKYGKEIYSHGYDVITTIKSDLQDAANRSLVNNLENYDLRHGYRGPEATYNLSLDLKENIDNYLNNFFEVNGNLPAVVLDVQDNIIKVYSKKKKLIDIPIYNILIKDKYLKQSYKQEIKNFKSILSKGDVIRIKEYNNIWFLSQIPKVNGALVSIDSNSGAITALSGGYDFKLSKFNRVILAKRQPGSVVKPFIYSAALNKGYTPASIINDEPKFFSGKTQSNTWAPKNYDNEYYGPVRLRFGLVKSLNMVSIELLENIGIDYVIDYLQNFSIPIENMPKDLSLALGTGEITPIQLAESYAYFANGGYAIKPYLIEQVRMRENNKIIYVENPIRVCTNPCDFMSLDALQFPNARSVEEIEKLREKAGTPRIALQKLDPRNMYQMVSMMKDVITQGTASAANVLNRSDIAGKTGTTNDQKDAWFVGFNRDIVTVSFVGFDKNTSLGSTEYGSTTALPIWIDYMAVALRGKPMSDLEIPDGLESVVIDSSTGLLSSSKTQHSIVEIFKKESIPELVNKENKNNEKKYKSLDDLIDQLF